MFKNVQSQPFQCQVWSTSAQFSLRYQHILNWQATRVKKEKKKNRKILASELILKKLRKGSSKRVEKFLVV